MANDFAGRIASALKKPQVYGFFVSVAVMAAVSLAFFAPDNFEGNVLQQHDMQQGAANGHEAMVYEQQTGEKALWTNSLFGGMPTFQISPSYPSNSLFTWLNTVYGLGLPAPSNLMFMMMAGMLILCYCCRMRWYYGLIAALAWGLSSYFVIIIGAGHIWKFLTLTYVPPTIGGLVVAYRGRWLWGAALTGLFAMLQLNANHPQITYYSAWLMGMLAVAYLVRAAFRRQWRPWLKGTTAVAVGGLLALGANLPSLYNTYEYSKQTKRAQSELTDPAAVQKATGERPTGGLPKAEIGGWSNTPSESVSLLVPDIKGGATIKPAGGYNRLLPVADLPAYQTQSQDDMFGLAQQMGQYFGGKGTTNGPFYVGAFIVALFLLGCLIVGGPVKWSLLVMTVFSVLVAMGNHFEALTDFLIYNVPLYNKFRAAETALVIAALCMPWLGLLALQKLFTTPDALRRYRLQIGIAFGLPMAVAAVAWLAPATFGAPFAAEETEALKQFYDQIAQEGPLYTEAYERNIGLIETLRLGLVSDDGARALMFLIAGLAVVLLGAARPKMRPGCIAAAALVVVFDMYGVDKRYIDHESFADGAATAVDPLAPDAADNLILQDKEYYRVTDLADFGGHRRSYYHHMTGGYHAAKLNRYNDLVNHRIAAATNTPGHAYLPELRDDSVRAALPEDRRRAADNIARAYRVLDMLNSKYIIDASGVHANAHAAGPAWLVPHITYVDGARAEMNATGAADPRAAAVADRSFADVLGGDPTMVPGDTISLVKYTPNTVTYRCSTRGGGIAVFSEVWFPWGWHARIDGKPAPLGRVNYVLRAMRVPAGTHDISMTFSPDSLRYTGAAAYASVSLIYLLLALALFAQYAGGLKTGHKIKK